MLATMTFSIEILICVVVGLGAGYAIFFQRDEEFLHNNGHVTTNPCCSFMDNEAKEVQSSAPSTSSDHGGETMPQLTV